ncbi:mechanosensitive ion channel family protein [Neosynechococcus sphagnicola]|uniref:mechanosensitive ion channel family protein n=1 Tax=Neosynechococcus sphagnicola TaxID=1501145 RepID=UPI000907ADE6|nr:mechanosensitive ion channel family protein [Neosynechococcus sphagnicola]
MVLLTVSETDVKISGKSRQALVQEYMETIRQAVGHYRQDRSLSSLIRGGLIDLLSTIALIVTFIIFNNIFPRFYRWLDEQRNRRIPSIGIQNFELLSSDQLSDLLLTLTSLLRLGLVLSLLYAYLSFSFSLFPATQHLGNTLFGYVQTLSKTIWNTFVSYLPNLFTLALIIALTYYFIRFLKLIFAGISRRAVSIQGFYPEWAEPTFRLLTYLTIALGAALAFPYLPGSESPAFRGISVFLGVLFSLGATGAVANIVAGIILIYTRAFQVGDRVKVADVLGDVEEKLLLVTRLRTLNNVLVTVPNSVLLSSNIINFSALIRDANTPLILHTTVTLGYDAPWRQIHQTLIAAALATPDILPEPPPFVLQTALNDFYVSYELKAYTLEPEKMAQIYSSLHQNIQDQCNAVGIEICSPHYAAVRDGNQTTIPANYQGKDYTAPGFRLHPLASLFNPAFKPADSGDTATSSPDPGDAY